MYGAADNGIIVDDFLQNGQSYQLKMIMDDLREIYERIKFLRNKGVKMKDIAVSTGYAPSVLSALFTTVMPEYFKNLDRGSPKARRSTMPLYG